jgi:hypothetical protein
LSRRKKNRNKSPATDLPALSAIGKKGGKLRKKKTEGAIARSVFFIAS